MSGPAAGSVSPLLSGAASRVSGHAPAACAVRLKAFFARQWRQMPAAGFMAVFGAYAQRIEEILPRFAAPVLAEAARQVTGTDAEIPELRPEEATT